MSEPVGWIIKAPRGTTISVSRYRGWSVHEVMRSGEKPVAWIIEGPDRHHIHASTHDGWEVTEILFGETKQLEMFRPQEAA